MNIIKAFTCIVVSTFLFSSNGMAAGADQAPLMVSKESNGKLNRDSRVAFRTLRAKAQRYGETPVWITLSETFLAPYLGQLTPEELDQQQLRATQQILEILEPLVDTGDARHGKDGPVIRGPGCLVMVNRFALRKLVRDPRISQIVGYRGE